MDVRRGICAIVPQLVFVPLMQSAINRRVGARVGVRQLGVSTVDARAVSTERESSDGRRFDRVLRLNMGIFKFSMNFLMNFCGHMQVLAALLIGGWMAHTDRIEIGGGVAKGRSGKLFQRFEHHAGEIRPGRREGEPLGQAPACLSDRRKHRISGESIKR
jgi:hypothetical protein